MTVRRILLVDDEAGLREAIADSLRMRGHWVTEAGDAGGALAAVEEQEFDILVTDIRLGRDDGLSLARTVRDKYPAIGLVFITGYGSLDLAIGAMRMGAADFIQKPFRLSVLAEAVDRIVPGAVAGDGAAGDEAARESVSGEPTEAKDERHEERALREVLWEAPARRESQSDEATP